MGRIPASSANSVARVALCADRTDTKVATASTSVPAAVAALAAVDTQSVIGQESKFTGVIEMLVFSLSAGADEEAFLACDRRVQTEFAYQQPGLLRRTTARAQHGGWAVIDIWASAEAADACDARWQADPVAQEFMAFVDSATVRTARFFERD
jgi:hypothetical protein